MGDMATDNNLSSPTAIPMRSSSSGLVNGARPKSSRQQGKALLEHNLQSSSVPMAVELPHKRPKVLVTDRITGSDASFPIAQHSSPTFEKPKLHRDRTSHSLHLETYFKGPRDIYRHSKWPYFLRLNGSVLPKMLLPLTMVASWAVLITCVSKFVYDLGIDSVLLTVLGFVVGLSLSFRSTTAYERYIEGRKYWAKLLLESRNLSRFIWIHVPERREEGKTDTAKAKADLLGKLSAMNLIVAFAVTLKHRLRFEPAADYPDLEPLIAHLDISTSTADPSVLHPPNDPPWHAAGQYLGVSFLTPNPRRLLKLHRSPGNLPLEILHHLASYIESLPLTSTAYQSSALASLASLTSILTGTERITNTPLPLAYQIAISQITWVYVLALPFQLYSPLGWITIPATIGAAYIILGLAAIGREIENPFGEDVNDLPLDAFCAEIRADIDVLIAKPAPSVDDFAGARGSRVLFPGSLDGGTVEEIWEALRRRRSGRGLEEVKMEV
jgi:ion channel-forming bestrophin family protein